MDMQYESDNAFPNLECILEPYFLEKALVRFQAICKAFV